MAGSARPTLSRQTDDKGIYHGRRYALRFPVLRATRCPKNYLQQNVSIFNFELIFRVNCAHLCWKFFSLWLSLEVCGNEPLAAGRWAEMRHRNGTTVQLTGGLRRWRAVPALHLSGRTQGSPLRKKIHLMANWFMRCGT